MLIERLREQRVELAVPVHVAAEPDGDAVGEHLDDAAERVAVLRRGLDLGDHRLLGRRVEAAHRGVVDALEVAGPRPLGRLRRGRPIWITWDSTSTPSSARSALASVPAADPRRGLARGGPLEHVAGVVEAVLLHAGEVGVPGPRLGERLLGGARRGRHLLVPLRPLGVADLDRHRRAERAAVADAAEEPDLVLLEAHAGTAAVAEAAAGELARDVFDRDGSPAGQALDDHDERLAVRLTGGQEAQHRSTVPAGSRPPGWGCSADDPQPTMRSDKSTTRYAPAQSAGPKGNAALRPRLNATQKPMTTPMIPPKNIAITAR